MQLGHTVIALTYSQSSSNYKAGLLARPSLMSVGAD